MIDARRKAIREILLIRVKFGFEEKSYDTLTLLAKEQKVSTAEIVRRALSLYSSCVRELKVKKQIVVSQESLNYD